MVRVIICGSRSLQDVKMLAENGVDGIGLITEVWQEIPCNLARTQAREFNQAIPPLVAGILIVTEEDPDRIREMVEMVKPDLLQLQGFNPASQLRQLKERIGVKIIKVLHAQGDGLVEPGDPVECALEYREAGADAILLDTYRPGKVGATGRPASWKLARKIRDEIAPTPFILAGGLNEDNVMEAIQTVQPFAVDVFSGVITEGYLDPGKVARLVQKVKVRSS